MHARGLVASKRVDERGAASVIDRLEQHGSAKIRLPRSESESLSAVTLNTAGGLTGDDRIEWGARAGARSRLTIASAACEKVYRTHGPPAYQSTRLDVAAGARLDWLPQETIVFEGARLHRTLEATLAAGARLLVAEALVLGRHAHGEHPVTLEIRDTWRVRHADGRLLHAEALRLDSDRTTAPGGRGALGGHGALATVLYCEDAPAETLGGMADALHALIERSAEPGTGGASALAGRVVIRLAAPTSFALRAMLLPCLSFLQGDAPVPRVWHV